MLRKYRDHSRSDRDKILMDIGKDPYVVSIKSKESISKTDANFQFTERIAIS